MFILNLTNLRLGKLVNSPRISELRVTESESLLLCQAVFRTREGQPWILPAIREENVVVPPNRHGCGAVTQFA